MPDKPTQPHFDPARVRRGNAMLLATAVMLGGVTCLGVWLREQPHQVFGENLGSVVFAVGLAGLVGFGTNWLAIKMLFHPRKKTLGFQGVIPRKRAEIAKRAALLMEERLISGHRLSAWLEQTGALKRAAAALQAALPALASGDEAKAALRNTVGEMLANAAPGIVEQLRESALAAIKEKAGFMAGMAMPLIEPVMADMTRKGEELIRDPAMLDKLLAGADLSALAAQATAGEQGRAKLESALAQGMETMLREVHIAALIEQEMLKQDDAELEAMVNDAAAEQLVFLQVAGGVLGAIAGLALVWPWVLAGIAGVVVLAALMGSGKRE